MTAATGILTTQVDVEATILHHSLLLMLVSHVGLVKVKMREDAQRLLHLTDQLLTQEVPLTNITTTAFPRLLEIALLPIAHLPSDQLATMNVPMLRLLWLLPTLLVLLTKLPTLEGQTNAIHLPNALVTDTAKLVDGAGEKATVDLYFPQDCDNKILN